MSVRERALDQFAPPAQQPLTAMATDPSKVGIESACSVCFARLTSAARDPVQQCRTSPGLPLKHGVLHFDKGTTTMNVVLLPRPDYNRTLKNR